MLMRVVRDKESFIEHYIDDPYRQDEICSELLKKDTEYDWLIQDTELLSEINNLISEFLTTHYAVSKENSAKELMKIMKNKALDYYQNEINSIISDEAHEAFYANEETD